MGDIADALYARFGQQGRIEDLHNAIAYYRQALNLCPAWNPSRSNTLTNLADAIFTRFQRLGKMKDLEDAVAYNYESLALRPPGDPRRGISLNNLAHVILPRFTQLGNMEDLEDAITYLRQSLAFHPPGHPNRADSLNNLATAVLTRFQQLGKMEDLEDAIACYRQSLTLHPPDHPHRAVSLSYLAGAIGTRFEQLGKMEDLEDMITYAHQSLALCPPGDPRRADLLNNLANAIRTHFERLGKMEDLEDAITYHRQSLTLCAPGDPRRADFLSNLADAVQTRFKQLGNKMDLEDTVTYFRQSLFLRPPGHRNRASSLSNLADAIVTRFREQGKMEDLEDAITYTRQSLALRPPGHPRRGDSLNNLANAVFTRFMQLGKVEDLEDGITYYRQSLALHLPAHPSHAISLNNLGNAIFTRFHELGKMEDLEDVITYTHQSLTLRPPGHPNRAHSLNNLAGAVLTRFTQLGKMKDLEDAIAYNYESLALRPPGHPYRIHSLNNIANAVETRFKLLGKMEDLEDAITYLRQSLAFHPPGYPDRANSLNSLANAIFTRFRQLGKMEDLEEVVKHRSDAEAESSADHPNLAKIQLALASSMFTLYDCRPKLDDSLHMVSRAFALLESATNHSPASGKARLEAALLWAQQARHRQHKSTVQAYSKSLTLLDHCFLTTPTVESQQKFLATAVPRSLALDAASSAIDDGQLETAVELLEQGRAILWSKLRGYRHSLEKLHLADRGLANQFETLSHRREHLAMSSESELLASSCGPDKASLGLSVPFDIMMRNHRILSEEWDAVVERIRRVDGFADFLQAVPFKTLQMAATDGPVIVVNVSEFRSDAITLFKAGPPVLIPLPKASLPALKRISTKLYSALDRFCGYSEKILSSLQDLWDFVVCPVEDKLNSLGVLYGMRIWWCPTSVLCGLPLHAAGPYRNGPKDFTNSYIYSYTPSLSALISARSGLVCRSTVPNLLFIGQEDDTIPKVAEELRRIRCIGGLVNVLSGENVSQDTVLSGLQQHPWAHFACHGLLNAQPFHSSFQLHNEEHLTLINIIKAQLPNAEFAFLSACHSAAGDRHDTPDEVVHLAAALQFCGFRSVVGTLWEMDDDDGPDVAEDFYKYMFRGSGGVGDFRESALALDQAMQAMRKRKDTTIDRWINFVHIGA